MFRDWDSVKPLALALLVSSAVGLVLFIYCSFLNDGIIYSFLLWNLFLAWIPLLISARLVYVLGYKLWSSWEAIFLTLAWLLFLPNSFYMISDFIHLQTAPTDNIVYYAVTFVSIIYTAVLLGFISLYMIHSELRKRFSPRAARLIVGLILAGCSIAIYVGRDLRWNSWDVLTNPGGVIFDLSYRLFHISNYPTALATGGVFFLLLASMYFLGWSGIKVIHRQRI